MSKIIEMELLYETNFWLVGSRSFFPVKFYFYLKKKRSNVRINTLVLSNSIFIKR